MLNTDHKVERDIWSGVGERWHSSTLQTSRCDICKQGHREENNILLSIPMFSSQRSFSILWGSPRLYREIDELELCLILNKWGGGESINLKLYYVSTFHQAEMEHKLDTIKHFSPTDFSPKVMHMLNSLSPKSMGLKVIFLARLCSQYLGLSNKKCLLWGRKPPLIDALSILITL